MSYTESKILGCPAITLRCDARRGGAVCGNMTMIARNTMEEVKQMLFDLGWRTLRGHQVCSSCAARKRIVFPRMRQKVED